MPVVWTVLDPWAGAEFWTNVTCVVSQCPVIHRIRKSCGIFTLDIPRMTLTVTTRTSNDGG